MDNRYIYIYLDPRKPGKFHYTNFSLLYEPFYVGKGTNDRKYHHLKEAYNHKDQNKHKCRIVRKIKKETSNDPFIIEIQNGLDEVEAIRAERKIIEMIGRVNKHNGPLTNQTDGGYNPVPAGSTYEEVFGKERAIKIKQKMSESHKGDKSCWYGVPKSDITKQRISETRIREGTGAGENNPMFGKNHTEDAKQRISNTRKDNWNEDRRQIYIKCNPKSKQVKTHEGLIFPSLSEAGKYYGFVGLSAPRTRIKNGVWKYI